MPAATDIQAKQAIEAALKAFAGRPLADAAAALFESLGYKSTRRLRLDSSSAENFVRHFVQNRPFNREQALVKDWQSANFLFQLTDEDLKGILAGDQPVLFESKGKWQDAIIESYVFLAIGLEAAHYTRSQLSGITRAVNRLFDMPALLLFKHGETVTLSVINRRLHKRDESKDVLEKVTLIKDIRFANPHRAHTEILSDLSLPCLYEAHQPGNFKDLHDAWQKTLDTSALNRRFYRELANWYFWALDEITFPKDAPKDRDGRDSLSVIRLITRLVFCWFLKEKGLIPEDLFAEKKVRTLLNSLEDGENSYYTAILQNLFFATLNTEMDPPGGAPSRRFIDEARDDDDSEDHMIHQVWRYADRIKDKPAFERLMRNIPFLNGGLFECLDERVEKGASSYLREIRVDGFSVKPAKQPKAPNCLFFGPERIIDLSKAYGELRYTQARVWPLVPLLERYKFTVSENTPIEEEVALDPELLGHVFENLLAAYNPETDTTARKTTGSFYTPRVVVDFMVDESLLAYLEPCLAHASPRAKLSPASRAAPAEIPAKAPSTDEKLRQLLAYTEAKPQFNDTETAILIDAIDRVKILDPACGSGAFPMGALHKLVFLLGKLDPGNAGWKQRQLAKAGQLDVGREGAERAVEDAFDRDQGDYARKLYLIENCLYGVDIQPIAVQIAKLRCFISLIVEQEPNDRLPNRGILPLPNLETKFIAANTLFGLHRRGQMELVAFDIEAKKSELRDVRHEHFRARKFSDKKKLRKRDKQIRLELAGLLKSSQLLSGPEAEIIASWDPYHADRNSPVFDPEWMFNLGGNAKRARGTLRGNFSLINEAPGQMELAPSPGAEEGFDIVIGNPPYVRQEELKNMRALEGTPGERPLKEALKEDYFCYTGVADLFVFFYEKAFDLLRVGGVLCFISSNKYFRAGYAEGLRHFLSSNGEVRLLIDFGETPVFAAVVEPSIILVRKVHETRDKSQLPTKKASVQNRSPLNSVRALAWEPGPPIDEFPERLAKESFPIRQKDLSPEGWTLVTPKVFRLLEKIQSAGPRLAQFVQCRFFSGIKTGHRAFSVDRQTRDRLIAEDKQSEHLLKPLLHGEDLRKWRSESSRYLIKIPSSQNKAHPWSGKPPGEAERIFAKAYPAIHAYFKPLRERLEDREDQGHYFWELRSCAYWHEFERPKILYMEINRTNSYCWDENGFVVNNKLFMLPDAPLGLLAVLNSLVGKWTIHKMLGVPFGGFLELQWPRFSRFPIPSRQNPEVDRLAREIVKRKAADIHAFIGDLESLLEGLVAHLYGLDEGDFRMILDDLILPDPTRIGALNAYKDTKQNVAK